MTAGLVPGHREKAMKTRSPHSRHLAAGLAPARTAVTAGLVLALTADYGDGHRRRHHGEVADPGGPTPRPGRSYSRPTAPRPRRAHRHRVTARSRPGRHPGRLAPAGGGRACAGPASAILAAPPRQRTPAQAS